MGWFDSVGSAVSGAASTVGDAASNLGGQLMDYYTMDSTPEEFAKNIDTKGADQWKMVGSSEAMSEEELKKLKDRMAKAGVAMPTEESVKAERMAAYNEEAKDKRLRRGITGALLGGAMGAAMHDGSSSPTRSSTVRATGGGKLGTGYNPLAQGGVFRRG